MGIFSFLFTIFFFIILMGLFIVGRVLRAIFGIHKTNSQYRNAQEQSESSDNYGSQNDSGKNENAQFTDGGKKKIYTKEDGEYVDYEEIKDK